VESARKMLAVLPFENLGSPDDEYFADGITEEITTCLAGLSGLGVISRTSSMQYKNSDKSLRQIGKELGVGYILEGTIRWEKKDSASRVRISPQLIKVSDDSHLWANRFDAVLTDVFEVQSTIAREVAAALDVTLLQKEQEVLSRTTEVDPRAYDYFLRGKQYFSVARYQQEEMRLAEMMYLKAIELAPDFAQAYAELGSLYTEMHWDLTDPSPQRLDSAKKMIDAAMRLASNTPEAHQALGWYYYHGLRDYEMALQEFSKVLELQPNNTLAIASMAWVQRRQAKWDEAISALQKVTKLDPRDTWYKYELGITFHYCRRFQDAVDQYDHAIDLQPSHKWAFILKSWALLNETGETREARGVLDAGRACNGRWPELTWLEVYYDLCDKDYDHALGLMTVPGEMLSPENPDTSDYYSLRGYTHKLMGQQQTASIYFDSARVRLEQKLSATPDIAPLLSSLANVYVGLGQIERAVSLARRAAELDPISDDALDGPNYVRTLAMVYAQTGQPDQAIDLLAHLLSIPSNLTVNTLKLMPEFAPLRDNARFQELLRRHGQEHAT
jgi:TolB-like protein/Flp pilus assembly protein TadD